MRFDLPWHARKRRREQQAGQWVPIFAWRPIIVKDTRGDDTYPRGHVIWLEPVARLLGGGTPFMPPGTTYYGPPALCVHDPILKKLKDALVVIQNQQGQSMSPAAAAAPIIGGAGGAGGYLGHSLGLGLGLGLGQLQAGHGGIAQQSHQAAAQGTGGVQGMRGGTCNNQAQNSPYHQGP